MNLSNKGLRAFHARAAFEYSNDPRAQKSFEVKRSQWWQNMFVIPFFIPRIIWEKNVHLGSNWKHNTFFCFGLNSSLERL